MFSSISWREFLTVVVIILFLYYFLVIVLYYRKDLSQLAKDGFHKKQIQVSPVAKIESTSVPDSNTILFSTVHELMEELKGLFTTASKNDYPKEELLTALKMKLRDYSQLKGTAFQAAVNNHISKESKDQCQTDLADIDLQQIW